MTKDADQEGCGDSASSLSARSSVQWKWVLLPIIVYVLLRLPTMLHAPGTQDEQWFAVPGWTVWNEGVPRIPYVPTRNRETLFENADRCLMALPPALFYVQAPFHAFFEPGYATSRIPLFLGALLTIAITYYVARRLGAGIASSLLASTLMAICRPLLFTGLTVRPDLLCAICGWISLILLWKYIQRPQLTKILGSGFVCGLAGLFHPFAVVFAMQSGIAMLIAKATIMQKVARLCWFGIACAGAIGLWVPLILAFPDEFKSQFFANVVDRAGPGLPSRLLWPWPSLKHHAWLLYEFAGTLQCVFFAVALVVGSIAVFCSLPRKNAIGYLSLCWSSVFLTAVAAGIHPTKGYWVYPALWVLGAFALAVDRWVLRLLATDDHPSKPAAFAFAGVVLMTLTLMGPGGGLRTTSLYWQRWWDPELHGPTFIENVLRDLPEEGLFLADLTYVYDLYLSGRQTMLCQQRKLYWGDQEINYEAILLAWEGEDANWAEQYDGELVKRYGSRELPQTCFVDLYRQQKNANGD